MSWTQVRDADMSVGYIGGWCLKYVQDAFHTDHISPTAMDDWNRQPNKHFDLPPLGMTVPVYFSLGNVSAGHVAIRLNDGYVASSTLGGSHAKPYFHPNIDDLIRIYGQYNGGCTYLGWAEHVGSVHVVEWVPDKVLATADQIKQAYLDILGRPYDDGGLNHYLHEVSMTIEEVRADLMASQERRDYEARLKAAADAAAAAAAQAKAEAEAQAEAAEEAARAKAAQEAAAAQATAEQAAKQKAIEEAIAQQKEADQAAANDLQNLIRENNALLKALTALVKPLIDKLNAILK